MLFFKSLIQQKMAVVELDSRPREGAQWLSGRVLDSRPRGRGFKPHWRHCVGSLSKNINPSLVLIQPWKTCPSFITERLLMGCKESNQTNKTEGLRVQASPASLCCVLEQDASILA